MGPSAAYASHIATSRTATHYHKRKLDAEPHLPIALGAAYEVLAQEMAAKGQQAKAISLLRRLWRAMGIHPFGLGFRKISTCLLWLDNPLRRCK